MHQSEIPEYIRNLFQSPMSSSAMRCLIKESTPVLAFGKFQKAQAATLGINPSRAEFIDKEGELLEGKKRRLATLRSLKLNKCAHATDAQMGQVIRDCENYFSEEMNPYMQWFRPLDALLTTAMGLSYKAGNACHIDVLPWSTDPVWGKLETAEKRALLVAGKQFLTDLIDHNKFEVILLNGKSVIDAFSSSVLELESFKQIEMLDQDGTPNGKYCGLYKGTYHNRRILGWTTNLQSSRGVTLKFRNFLADEVRTALSTG
jgi:hypothetical protein